MMMSKKKLSILFLDQYPHIFKVKMMGQVLSMNLTEPIVHYRE